MAINNPVVADNDIIQNIAVAIQRKDNGGKMEFPDMPNRIDAISTGSTLIPKTITENGVYNASSDNADGYDVVTVSVHEKNTLDEYFANTLEVANIPSARSTVPREFFANKSNLVNVIIPNVTSIGTGAFQSCTNLVNVIMPNVTSIDSSAFRFCKSLALTALPDGVTSIGNTTFGDCKGLALTALPDGVTSIGTYAFSACKNIPYLDFSDFTGIPTVTATSFSFTTFPFYFRDQQQLDEWAAATNWSTYADRFQIKPSEVI